MPAFANIYYPFWNRLRRVVSFDFLILHDPWARPASHARHRRCGICRYLVPKCDPATLKSKHLPWHAPCPLEVGQLKYSLRALKATASKRGSNATAESCRVE